MAGLSERVSVYCLIFVYLHTHCAGITPGEYDAARQKIIDGERSQRLGASLKLAPLEQKVSELLLAAKKEEIESARVNGTIFPPAVNFFKTKKLIEKSRVFEIIQQMPKGGALHTHDSSITSIEWLVMNVTYRPNCYMCYDKNGVLNMHFYKSPPSDKKCSWKTVKSQRDASGNVKAFDQYLIGNISIVVDNPDEVYVTVNDVWKKFGGYFQVVNGLFFYEPVFRDYFLQALTEFQADNVQYIEIRALLPELYDLDGTKYDAEYTLNVYRNLTQQFVQANPTFIGCKIIQSGIRSFSVSSIMDNLQQAIRLYKKYPDIFRGYDLVGQEGTGNPLHFYLKDLLYPSQHSPPIDIPYFFHAGETDWEGTQVDLNLVDAVLLNTSRIGHGYALYKHPDVLKMIKARGIAVEVNPISNQVLRLVSDLRNHGAVTLFAENYPVVVSSDDPAPWGALPLSHDFYMAFMAFAGEDDGLKVLKQLAMNSINALTDTEKSAAMAKWEHQWDIFINKVLFLNYKNYIFIG